MSYTQHLPQRHRDAPWKVPVRVATTADGTFGSAYDAGSTVDGVTLATGDRILIKDQATGAQNGIYIVAASGAPSRADDGDTENEIIGAVVRVLEGIANAQTMWAADADETYVIDSTALAFELVGSVSGVIAPNVLYAECNSPAGSGGDNPVPWDTFYDETQSTISGGTLTAALAAIGLTAPGAGNQFFASAPGVYALELEYVPKAAPAGQVNTIKFSTSGYLGDPLSRWTSTDTPNPPSNRDRNISLMLYLGIGDSFEVVTTATGTVTDAVITYADMSIMKVV